jgi:hypothetical protein
MLLHRKTVAHNFLQQEVETKIHLGTDVLSLKSMYPEIVFSRKQRVGYLLWRKEKLRRKERQNPMSEQKNQWDGQSLPQGMVQEIQEQELDTVTGSMPDRPIVPTNQPNTYLFEGSRPPTAVRPSEMVTLQTTNPFRPDHQAVTRTMQPGTMLQHVPVLQAGGTIQHIYLEIQPR